jgi:hypothetical protein
MGIAPSKVFIGDAAHQETPRLPSSNLRFSLLNFNPLNQMPPWLLHPEALSESALSFAERYPIYHIQIENAMRDPLSPFYSRGPSLSHGQDTIIENTRAQRTSLHFPGVVTSNVMSPPSQFHLLRRPLVYDHRGNRRTVSREVTNDGLEHWVIESDGEFEEDTVTSQIVSQDEITEDADVSHSAETLEPAQEHPHKTENVSF